MLLLFISCEEQYLPEINKYQNLIVVEGMLTDKAGSMVIKLSSSSPVYEKKYRPLSGGELFLSSQNQEVARLVETDPGVYIPTDSSFHGQVGQYYQLHIQLPDGRSYQSDDCLLHPSAVIDSVYGIIELEGQSESSRDFPGVQFYVENHAVTNDTMYYLWRLNQTYKYRSTFDIDYTWEGEYIPYPDPDSLRTCWITEKVSQFFFASTEYLNPTAINRFPLHFVSTADKTLSIRYSLMVKQFNVTEDAFTFFSALEQQNIEQGDLWAKQPIQIRGNMHRVGDESESVLGFFIVAGETQRRIFINRPGILFYYTECTPDFEIRWVPFSSPYVWPIYFDDIMFLYLATADSKSCFDCRLSGGNITPPDFWENY